VTETFAPSASLSLGVEEELMILDGDSLLPAPAVGDLVAAAEEGDVPGRLKTELFAFVVELNTDVCSSAREAAVAVRALRAVTAALAEERGLRIAAGATHPLAVAADQQIVDEPRYRKMVEYVGPSARRQVVNGLHVHVGMPDAAACLHTLEWVLPWLPLVLALSANSPYLEGEETAMQSIRAEVLSLLPRAGPPPRMRSYDEWSEFVDRLVATGLVADYTALWWDVRAHPRFGTLEVRMPDQPTDVRITAALVALVQALCAVALEQPPRAVVPGDRAVYRQNRWAAARFGLDAELVHPADSRLVPARELSHELLELVRPAAERLDSLFLLDELDPDRSESERQLEIGRRDGLDAVCADLVARTVASRAEWPASATPSR
jgi:carboxylate-amine ligase